ncbi:MAG: hypothetical protein E7604_03360 [Ruminococcaceae bacterium]|nr:hypothetical protein [Oscillospiraceae bacterium]
MNFKQISSAYYPAYTWLWNTTATKEKIEAQIDEMYDAGIRAFYVLGEPENFRPTTRRTHLRPEYLSDEYIELVYHAYEYAAARGMYTWLYNEGGFPSGFAGGLVRQADPSTGIRAIGARTVTLDAGAAYTPSPDALAAYCGDDRITAGQIFSEAVTVTEYADVEGDAPRCTRTDNASRRNVALFLALTHEKLKSRFGDVMGTDVVYMFDDEAFMGTWTPGMDRMFSEKYGYDMLDYLPYITRRAEPVTEVQARAVSDYHMLCGELVRDNYFVPMKQWLNAHGMKSVGHLDNENSMRHIFNRYGDSMELFRAFDVPGVDVIWSQITYPHPDGRCCKDRPYDRDNGNFEFFPRLASSAAHQCGHSVALSESFAVYGSHVTPEEMRFVVNFQAVRGISLFNFMVVSLDRSSAMCLQYRPNFNPTNPGMDMLHGINDYTARLSAILQNSRPVITSALYYPYRTVGACGCWGQEAAKTFVDLGHMLEDAGVSFDIIDEALVRDAALVSYDGGTALVYNGVRYDNVFVPDGVSMEDGAVLAKMHACGHTVVPVMQRTRRDIHGRHIVLDDGTEGYFICSAAGETVSDTVRIQSTRIPYAVDLETGELCTVEYSREGGTLVLPVTLLRGAGMMLILTEEQQDACPLYRETERAVLPLTDAYIRRRYSLDVSAGPQNTYFSAADGAHLPGLGLWDASVSGEAVYTFRVETLPQRSDTGKLVLDLGEVHHFARVFRNGTQIGEITMPPYRMMLSEVCVGDEISVTVANTTANVCHNDPFFDAVEPYYVGTYHENMKKVEVLAPAGGLIGPVSIAAYEAADDLKSE